MREPIDAVDWSSAADPWSTIDQPVINPNTFVKLTLFNTRTDAGFVVHAAEKIERCSIVGRLSGTNACVSSYAVIPSRTICIGHELHTITAARAREESIKHHLKIQPYMFFCRDTETASVYASKASPRIDTHLQDINQHGIMQFIHHDEENCNVKFMRLKNHVFVVSLKHINIGEELLINYNNHQNYTQGDEKRIDESNDDLVFGNDDNDDDTQAECYRCGNDTNPDKLVSCCFRRKRRKKGSTSDCRKSSCFKCLGWKKRRSDKVFCQYVSSLASL